MTDLRDDKRLWGLGEVLRLSWPASMTMLSFTIMQFVDGLMVSRLGRPGTFAAQNVGGLMSFIPVSLAMGVLIVVNTFVSQNLGADRPGRCGQYAWAGIYLAAAFYVAIAPLAALAPRLFGLFPLQPEVRRLSGMYFTYMILGALPELTSRALAQFFFGIHRPRIVFVSAAVANGLNVLANYALIFGKLGMPKLGLEGAAIGTVCGFVVQMLILLGVFLSRPMRARYGTGMPAAARFAQCADLLRIGWPAGIQFSNDIFVWSLFTTYLVGQFGTSHLAANTAAVRFTSLSFMPTIGIGIATTALVGRYIGRGRADLARRRAHSALLAAMAYMGACGVAFLLFRHRMVELFIRVMPSATLSPQQAQQQAAEIVRIGGRIMLCAAAFQLMDAVSIVFVGALRGAGDTRWPMMVTILLSWLFCLGGGLTVVRLAPELTSVGPWLAAGVYVLALGGALAFRFESGAWRKIDLLARTLGRAAPAPAPAGPVAPAARPPLPAGTDDNAGEQT